MLRCNVALAGTRIRVPEDDADASKHVAVLTVYRILFIYIYIVHLLVWMMINT
jgi:hypothetical protein